ncbi:glycoside hydrolase family 32 protein [Vibrio nitrifigilis]|uniref:Sucrose-6-phosphate hydrolase n=1 Tax=Vibrio nitrifigilis TaxID=2789781 RepID=A0ABS0GEN2_9VIBR|nr:glycoside hydrolase family 32 protein [Vibrio nitrifigilis]MBF9000837.1 glycoside hydrolase family 32 protein [Vibrio nitrifigilis]
MSLIDLIELAGGETNIRRILAPKGKVIVAVHNDELVRPLPESITAQTVLGELQLSTARGEVTDEELQTVGESIAQHQREQVEPYLQPTESHYRPQWHISPPQGLVNDPNGFIYHKGEYHLFYQWYPYACEHKDKHWVHLKSQDLINWHHQSIALTPSDWFDSHGVFSGHAVSQDDGLWLFYTGNVRIGEQRDRQTTQCMAFAADGLNFKKHGPVIRELPPGVTEHIRDPKLVFANDKWFMLLGAQTTDLQGRLAVYHSEDLVHWTYDRLYGDELAPFGYMWECPDWFKLGDEQFIVFGPQGIEDSNPNHTIGHQNRIFRMSLDQDDALHLIEGWQLDAGFDFYAPQSMEAADGRRLMIGWMGLPDEVNQPSCDHGWIHQLTTLRELYWQDGKVKQRPAKELAELRGDKVNITVDNKAIDLGTKSVELHLNLAWGSELQLMQNSDYHVSLVADAEKGVLRFDRHQTEIREGDVIRELPLESDTIALTILADNSSLEIFINDGEKVMTGRVFTPQDATNIRLVSGEPISMSYYPLKAARAPYPSV